MRQRGAFTHHDVALDYDDLYDIAVLAGALTQQNVGEAHPLLSTGLPDGSRIQVVLPPCVPAGTASLTIRVHGRHVADIEAASKRYDLQRWNQWQNRRAA